MPSPKPLFSLLICAALALPACSAQEAAQPAPIVQVDDAPELATLWTALRDKAAAGDTAGVLAALEAFALTEDETKRLFGPEVGARVWAGYQGELLPALRKEAPAVIVEQVKAGLNEVLAEQVGAAYPARTTRGDEQVLAALQLPARLYTVKLRKPGEELGLRFNGFVKVDGKWRMLLKSDVYLAPPPDAAPPAPAAADVGVPAPAPPSE